MEMSGSHRLSDMSLQKYSLDSINEFLRMETVTQDKLAENRDSEKTLSENMREHDVALQSAYSFAKKEGERLTDSGM